MTRLHLSVASRSRRRISLALASIAFLGAPASAGVLVVDSQGGPGSQFTEVNQAVNAAVDGDIVLVRAGSYDPVFVGNKSITIQGEGSVSLIDPAFKGGGGLSIFGVAAGKRLVIRNLVFWGHISFANGIPSTALSIGNCAGTVWLDQCTVKTQTFATNCADLVITNSNLYGGDCLAPPLQALPALILSGSNTYVHRSILVGGTGSGAETTGVQFPDLAAIGAPALRATGGTTLVSRSKLTGGTGGSGYDHPIAGCLVAGAGGPALHLAGGNPVVRHVASLLAIGTPGSTPAPCSPPASGSVTVVETGTLIAWSGAPVLYSAQSPVREQQNLTLQIIDVPGASALVLASAAPASVLLPPHVGALHLAAPLFVAPLGTIPAGGTLVVNVLVPNLPAGVDGVVVFTQGASCPPAAPCTVGTPSAVVVLDSSL